MKMSPFSAPFSGHPKSEGCCFQSERLLYGREPNGRRSGGTGKAEGTKLPSAGTGPKQCPGKCAAEKGYLPKSVSIGVRSRLELCRTARIIRTARPPRDRRV